jgi:ABC-type protease/lipase transport system fused ATPase/permease subunit
LGKSEHGYRLEGQTMKMAIKIMLYSLILMVLLVIPPFYMTQYYWDLLWVRVAGFLVMFVNLILSVGVLKRMINLEYKKEMREGKNNGWRY